jgi:hypothetical protein
MPLVVTSQSVTVAEFAQLFHGRLKPCDFVLLGLVGSEFLREESSEQ